MLGGAWLALAAVAWCARAGPGPPSAALLSPAPAPDPGLLLRFEHTLYNLSIPENSPPRTQARAPPDEPPLGVRLPAPGTRVRFRIRHGDKDKFFKAEEHTVGDFCFASVRTRAGHADVLNRERRDRYRLELRASATLPSGARLETDTSIELSVGDVNDLSPLFYPTEYDVLVPEDTPPHSSVARVSAEDADLGLNGEIYYSFAERTDQFSVHPTSGVVSLTRPLDYNERAKHEVTVLAHDRASLLVRGSDAPAARARLIVRVARANLHAPEIRARRLPELVENSTAEVYAIVEVTDRDGGEHGRIASVEIVDGDPDGHFRVRPSATAGEWDVLVHALLDREHAPRGYNLTLRADDAGKPPRSSYLALPVQLADANDHAPVFSREIYEASVPETAPARTPLVRLKVTDRDDGANARVYIEIVGGNEGGEFLVNPETGVLYTAVPLDAEQKALYTLTVSAVDQGNAGTRKQSSAKVKISVLDANDNDPVFEPSELTATVHENGPPGAVVARVTARDADSGENAYISYSIANLQPVPFDVDHFSGAVRTTRLLDYESMRREWIVRVRASDWGLPYRRQAELRLTVRLQDVNDNRPQFERTDCVGYVPRRLSPGTELATLSAIDFDAGDVVSYRLIGGNEDNCFTLDSGTGVLSLACDLADVRVDTRVLNVTATDGTHFADATSVTLHLGGSGGALECRDAGVARRLTELLAASERSNAPLDPSDEFPPAPSRYGENLHAPEFVDFPVEVKVNESVALGTTLVKLRGRDRDLGYNGLLAFAISGGDDDSAFRIDPDTGELQVIGYLDREREGEYFLNVTVCDLGKPARAASRLLPITILDVNDNAPRFDKTLASFRVTENALNGTAVFRAHATDRDAGEFAQITYSLDSAGAGEFCVDRIAGTLVVCAPLDRETRALYELTLRATDGGGLRSEALVRVAVDDVNDNAPQFALPGYSARVREDVPVGTLVALLDAADPDLGAGGRVTYSLPDQPTDDQVFTVDETSGALRTAKPLDYEDRQVYGVTVRATDGGQPALWAEATLIVEVLDVDENGHAPQFADSVLAGAVREDAPRGASVLTCDARDADPPGRDSRLSYYVLGGTGMGYFSIDDAGVVRTLAPLDRETAPHYWLTVCAEDHGLIPRHACVQVYIEVSDVNDMAPWPERALYAVTVPEQCAAGTRVVTVTSHDADLPPGGNVSYRIVAGNPDGLFSIDDHTGDIVTTGRALDRESAATHALEVRCSDGTLAASARVHVALTDINDHAPAFTQRFYQLRAPVLSAHQLLLPQGDAADTSEDEASTEWEAEADTEDEDEGSGEDKPAWDLYDDDPPRGFYVGTVLALDGDAGANGSVVYSARARGSRALRVHARSGRLLLAPAAAPLRVGAVTDLTVRACDGGRPARCGVARVSVRGVSPGGGAPPHLPPPPAPLQVAELDAPGSLLTLLQAHDPDGDPLYYDIVDGDPRSEWHLGREDGSLVLARRLRWERQALYTLNVSVSDGTHVVYTPVNITVVNDVNEAGLSFSQEEYTVEVGEDARVGEPLLALQAGSGGAGRVLYGIQDARAPASLSLFRLQELTGVLELAQPLDRETAALHELTVWARDSAPRASRAYTRVRVVVHDADEHAPEWGRRLARARVPATAPPGALVTTLRATDRDSGEHARVVYSLAGGDAAGAFTVHPSLGEVRLARAPGPAAEYTLHVRAANPPPGGRHNTLPLHVIVVEPDTAPPTFTESAVVCEVYENAPAGTLLAALEARSGSAVRYELRGGGGRGLFRVNPAAGVLSTAAPLDYETQSLYNLTVVATNMGGGTAVATVTVHVLDVNEFPPVLTAREYRGAVSEAAAAGALVAAAGSAEPLVLSARDGDSPANWQRDYEILDPAAARAFRLDPTTGALALRAQLDAETQRRYEFTVKVVDMGTPRLPSDSVARVVVDVVDVNDCAPTFSQPLYVARVLLPSARDVLVVHLAARDADSPSDTLKYDVLEGDADGAFLLRGDGALVVAREDALPSEARLRVRVSDGQLSSTTRVHVSARAPEPAGLAFTKADYYGSVVENTTRPSTVLVLDVLGAALNEHVQFRILNPVPGFQIGVTSGAVTAGGVALDREARAHYTLLVEARSGGGEEGGAGGERVAHARLHVAVTDVNDNCPVFVERPYVAAVRAGDPPGTDVLRVHAVDADDNDNGEVRYEMKRGHGELFRVDRHSGQLSLKQTLDAHNHLYELVIAAFDGGTPACGAEAAVSVRVWRGGAAPAWERAHYALSAREDTPPGAPLAAPLRAHSPLQRQLIYTLLQPDLHPAIELHFDTAHDRGNSPCVLVCAAALDHESEPVHTLTVRATDGVTGAHADVGVSLAVLDVNDCAPEWERDAYSADVSEAARVGDLVIAVRATDNDTGLNGEVQYSVSGDWEPARPLFSVDGAGAVRVAGPLDRELAATHHVLLVATDRGSPPAATTAHLFITVEDVNDSAPRMERSVVSAVVSSEAARGVAVAAVAAWDPDARDSTRLQYALASHDPHHTFAVHPRTGLITLANTRAWAQRAAPLSLNVSVSDGAHAAFARVKLTPAPANAHAPHFQHLLLEAQAQENQPPPLLLTTVKAYDEDGGEYGTVSYSIPSALLRDTFTIDATSGALSTRVPLDREARAEWLVPVTASDGGGRLRHTTVRVRVADLNDNAPAFPHREYRATVRHDRAPGTPFLTLTARDDDAGEHARLAYTVYEGDDDELHSDARGLFRVDSRTGALELARNATHFAGKVVRVWVRATDGGGRAAEAPVSLYVLAEGEAAPHLVAPPADLFLPEDAAPGTLIAELGGGGGSGGVRDEVHYRLAAGSWPRDQFAIDDAGRLVLAAALDREAAPQHSIGVIAEGLGSPAPASMAQLTLHVLDVNEHAPSFHSQPYVVQLAENTPPHSSVVQVMAEDPDAGANGEVRYSLTEESAGALFTLDPHTGWLVTAAPLDREAAPEHRLQVLATDGGTTRRVARGSVVVRLRDYNDCPPRFARDSYVAAVREDAPPGTVALRLEVTDPDLSTAPLAFHVADGDPTARFALRPTGELFVARALDRETAPRHDLTVLATDGKFSTTARVRVDVLDANDNPPYCLRHRYYARLREDAPVGGGVVTVAASDADEPQNARLRFYLSGDGAEHFAVHKEAGRVSVAAPLDRETRAFYRLVAHAQDRDRPEWECVSELLVSVDDVNDNAPRFSAPRYSVTLPEDAELGTLVAKVHATDADLGANRLLRYSLLDEPTGAFELAPDSGIVTLRTPLDRETAASHRLVVRAQDAGEPSLSATALVLLTVADVNDNPPEFEFARYEAVAPELDAVGTEVVRVAATSKDTGVNAEVYYSIVAGDEREDFSIDRVTGVVSVARPLDYERTREYTLTVQAIDGGSPPLSDHAVVNITVLDCNDNAPSFSQASYGARVREDAALGSRVLQVVALDADAGANGRVTYSIARGDRDGRFAIDADTGYVSLVAPLDRETTPAYVLEVRARDHGEPSLGAQTTVNVEVLDANDNAPRFAQSNYSCVVQEGRALGAAVLELRVSDADAAPNAAPYTFDLQAGNEAGAFRLEQDGVLRTATRFNHRIKDRYVLQIRVFDNGTPPLFSDAWVTVRVIEESQYPPVVTPLDVQLNSYLDEFPGGELGRVHASDRDAYDSLTWALAPADPAPLAALHLFSVDARDGTLRAEPRLDPGEYRLNVTVSDGRFVSAALVRVAVKLVTDEMLAQAVVVRFREVTDVDFVLSHRKGFVRAVREAMDCAPGDVVIISVQPSGDDVNELPRVRRQVAQDLDVLFCVRAGLGWAPAETLRRRLHAHLERLEERTRLVVEELVRAACGGCVRGACGERAELAPGRVRAVAADVFSLVAPPHRLAAACVCEPGYGGERCERVVSECARAECPAGARCEEMAVPPGYRCCVSGECRAPPPIAHFAGDGYALYRLDKGVVNGERLLEDELVLSVRFRTLAPHGTLVYAAGRVDYLVLEIVDGFVALRMELGAGEAVARADAPVSDGAWHVARVERRGGSARLSVDRHTALLQAPPPAAVLDTGDDHLYVGAALVRHAHANAPPQVTRGFVGCIAELRLSGAALPLVEGGAAGGEAALARAVRVRTLPVCADLTVPGVCASYPCLNGGTCVETAGLLAGAGDGAPTDGWQCTCHARYGGARCELDRAPCAGRPCLHGGVCAPSGEPPGYTCACAAPAGGPRCEHGRYCVPGVCGHGGSCEEGAWGPSCRCRGYYGPLCQHDVDECAGEPCAEGATCLNEPGSFRCVCPPGRTGTHCGNPLTSGAVLAAEAGGGPGALWAWVRTAGWPLWAGGSLLLAAVLLLALLPLLCRRRSPPPLPAGKEAPLNSHLAEKLPSKLSNLAAARRERPSSCAEAALNNADTLRSYGSAGDELEGMPPDYLRNLNIDRDALEAPRKPWSEQMHLHTFTDNKIYNDLRGSKSTRPSSPASTAPSLSALRGARRVPGGAGGCAGGAGGGDLVGGYHWDCSDWCGGGGALPAITEVTAGERRDSTSPSSAGRGRGGAPLSPHRLDLDTSSGLDDDDHRYDFTDACTYLVHPDAYLPRAGDECGGSAGGGAGDGDGTLRALRLREPDAASLITMLEERNSLLGGTERCGSGSDVSARLCEIEESDVEVETSPLSCRHTDV